METTKKIYLIRKSLGWSQEAFDTSIGLCQRQYGRIENGENKLTMPKFEEICKIWGISQSEFYGMDVGPLSDIIRERQKR